MTRPAETPVPFDIITSDAALREYLGKIAGTREIAIDTEFVGERSYYPALELIQLSDGRDNHAVIDVREIKDPSLLKPLVCDGGITKILHAGGQDIPILEEYMGEPPAGIFDTQLAAAMAGMGPQVSYANLAKDLAGAHINKKHTVSDWSRRPLSKEQLRYAVEDVLNLHTMWGKLVELLSRQGRLEWFEEEQLVRIESARRNEEMPDEEMHTIVKEWGKLSGLDLCVLRELAIWRENEARSRNLPRRRLLPDQAMVNLARLAPTSRGEVRDMRHLPQGPVQRSLDDILEVIKRAKAIPREDWPTKPRPARQDLPPGMTELLAALLRSVAEEKNIASTLLATSSDLSAIVNNRRHLDQLDVPVLKGWRRRLIGQRFVDLLEGRIAVRIDGNSVVCDTIEK